MSHQALAARVVPSGLVGPEGQAAGAGPMYVGIHTSAAGAEDLAGNPSPVGPATGVRIDSATSAAPGLAFGAVRGADPQAEAVTTSLIAPVAPVAGRSPRVANLATDDRVFPAWTAAARGDTGAGAWDIAWMRPTYGDQRGDTDYHWFPGFDDDGDGNALDYAAPRREADAAP